MKVLLGLAIAVIVGGAASGHLLGLLAEIQTALSSVTL